MQTEGDSLLSGLVGNYSAESILTSIVVSAVGYVAFAYGKKQRRIPQVVVGLTLMIFPYFVTNVFAMIGIAGLLVALLFFVVRAGY